MATAHSARLRARATATVIVVTAALAAAVAPSVAAAPQLTISQVEARISALNNQAEKITEAYDLARQKLTALQRQQTVTAHQLASEQARLAAVQKTISATANAAYRSGGVGSLFLGDATSPEQFLDQAVTLDAISRAQAEQFANAAAAGHAVEVAKSTYDAQAAVVRSSVQRIGGQKAHIEQLLAQAHHLLDGLRADQRARLAAAAAREQSQQLALRNSYSGPARGQAAVAVHFAYAQLGKPYYYGGAGPNSYDCSGLTMAAWGAAGVSLPHNAAAQQSMLPRVSSPQPGDLVFFGSPAYHVGIYIGNGNMIAAPHTGDVVKIEAVYSGVSGYGRP